MIAANYIYLDSVANGRCQPGERRDGALVGHGFHADRVYLDGYKLKDVFRGVPQMVPSIRERQYCLKASLMSLRLPYVLPVLS